MSVNSAKPSKIKFMTTTGLDALISSIHSVCSMLGDVCSSCLINDKLCEKQVDACPEFHIFI